MENDIKDEEFIAEMIETDINDLCRVCGNMSSHALISIFEDNDVIEDLASKIMLYLPIKVCENDLLPVKACVNCTNSVIRWHLLYEGCVDADKRFKAMLSEEELVEQPISQELHDHDEDSRLTIEDIPQSGGSNADESDAFTSAKSDDEMEAVVYLKEDDENIEILKESDECSEANATANEDNPEPFKQENCQHSLLSCRTCRVKIQNIMDEISCHMTLTDNKCELYCKRCGIIFKDISTRSIIYSCQICDASFINKSDMRKHISEHDLITCPTCNKTFKTYSNLIAHKRLHSAGELTYYYCPICDWQTNRKYNLQIHINSHVFDHYCKICCCSYNSERILENHKASHTKDELANYMQGYEKVECQDCNETFYSKYKLYVHKLEQHDLSKNFKCGCGRMFETDAMLRNHEKTHNKPVYECKLCKKKFTKLKNFIEHENAHFDNRPFKCDMCEKRFRYSSNLSQHKAMHKGVKNYTCMYCDRKFLRSNTLNMHLRTHRNERNYSCDICSATFVQSSSLMKHKRTIHRTCGLCGKMVGDRKQWQIHVWKECTASDNIGHTTENG